MTQTTGTSSSPAKVGLPLLVLVILAAALRIFDISHESLWLDEIASWSFATRSLSVVPGIMATCVIYRFTAKLFNRNAAILAAGLQTIGTFQIFYSQEARCFAWLGTMILSAGLCLWNALAPVEVRKQLLWYLGYVLLTVAACYMHFIAVFFIAAQGIYVLARKRTEWLKAGASFALCGALFLPWLVAMVAAA